MLPSLLSIGLLSEIEFGHYLGLHFGHQAPHLLEFAKVLRVKCHQPCHAREMPCSLHHRELEAQKPEVHRHDLTHLGKGHLDNAVRSPILAFNAGFPSIHERCHLRDGTGVHELGPIPELQLALPEDGRFSEDERLGLLERHLLALLLHGSEPDKHALVLDDVWAHGQHLCQLREDATHVQKQFRKLLCKSLVICSRGGC
mmetsp:Transcript_122641/g.392613  ORF Transcript_122641/g.392613 Transcript_122641/m.392613 type:complete len:200 (-) Transcript_122641:342-941(-)